MSEKGNPARSGVLAGGGWSTGDQIVDEVVEGFVCDMNRLRVNDPTIGEDIVVTRARFEQFEQVSTNCCENRERLSDQEHARVIDTPTQLCACNGGRPSLVSCGLDRKYTTCKIFLLCNSHTGPFN